MQCDKRNSYRHRVKQEKAAAAADATDKGENTALEGQANGDANGHVETDGAERPAKKLKGPDGVVVTTPGVGAEDDDVDDEGEDDEGEDADEEDGADETMEDADDDDEEEVEEDGENGERGEVRDEALDDGEESD